MIRPRVKQCLQLHNGSVTFRYSMAARVDCVRSTLHRTKDRLEIPSFEKTSSVPLSFALHLEVNRQVFPLDPVAPV
jgi:hypothetical protein